MELAQSPSTHSCHVWAFSYHVVQHLGLVIFHFRNILFSIFRIYFGVFEERIYLTSILELHFVDSGSFGVLVQGVFTHDLDTQMRRLLECFFLRFVRGVYCGPGSEVVFEYCSL